MVEIDATTDRRGDVTFVTAAITNTQSTAQRVRLRSTLSGPTWPPRRGSVTVPEWDDDAWEATVPPGTCVGVGFATPAEPSESPIELVSVDRATDDDDLSDSRDVLTMLDDWTPPRSALSSDGSADERR